MGLSMWTRSGSAAGDGFQGNVAAAKFSRAVGHLAKEGGGHSIAATWGQGGFWSRRQAVSTQMVILQLYGDKRSHSSQRC